MSDSKNRFLVSAALLRLVNGTSDSWLDDAKLVVNFGLKIPPTEGNFTLGLTNKDETSITKGFAAGFGDVSISERREGPREYSRGVSIEKIGHFRVINQILLQCITFWHFKDGLLWHSNLDSAEPPRQFTVFYDQSQEPYVFGEKVYKRIPTPYRRRIAGWLWSLSRHAKALLQGKRVVPRLIQIASASFVGVLVHHTTRGWEPGTTVSIEELL